MTANHLTLIRSVLLASATLAPQRKRIMRKKFGL